MAQQIGAIQLPMKDPGGPWRGMTLRSGATPGGFSLIENGYISSDGLEIRSFPGYVCVIDPETQERKNDGTDTTTGYRATHIDSRRDVWTTSGNYDIEMSGSDSLRIWTEPEQLHFVENISGRWVFVGEDTFRREPIYNAAKTAFVTLEEVESDGTFVYFRVSAVPYGGGGGEHNSADNADCNFTIYVTGVTGAMASIVNGKSWIIDQVAGGGGWAGRELRSTYVAAVGVSSTQTARIDKVTEAAFFPTTITGDDVPSLTTWTAVSSVNPYGSAVTDVHAAHVFNRQRDFGDYSGTINEGQDVANSRSRRRQASIPYRLVPHKTSSRIIMAAPGYGCAFQIPFVVPIDYGTATPALGLAMIGNEIYDRPRSVGVPKCVCWIDSNTTVGASIHFHVTAVANQMFGGPTHPERNGTYQFRFAYKDESTGEIGLWSEPVTLTTSGANDIGLAFYIMHPGYLMPETGALSVVVWRTTKNGTTFYYDRTIGSSTPNMDMAAGSVVQGASPGGKYGLTPTTFYSHFWLYFAYWCSDDELRGRDGPTVPSINEMPMGCNAARTIRGFTFYGGAIGNSGSMNELQSGRLSCQYFTPAAYAHSPYENYDELTARFAVGDGGKGVPAAVAGNYVGVDAPFNTARSGIAPAYTGQYVFSPVLMPSGSKMVRLDKLKNTETSGDTALTLLGRMTDLKYGISETPLDVNYAYEYANSINALSYLVLPTTKVWFSEPDNPGVTPDANTIEVNADSREAVTAIGDCNGQAVVCTKNKTYYIGFSTGPLGSSPSNVTDKFGCIAPNSMVTYDDGCAWISDRGPVAMGGGIRWIGKDIEPLFHGSSARYLRDSKGMMRHSWACHDAERGLIYFGVFANRFAGTASEVTVSYRGTSYTWTAAAAHSDADKIQSRFPCDEVLIYSYSVDAWSVWRPPATLAIQWMTVGQDNEPGGVTRVFFLGSDRRLYAMDDAFGMFERESPNVSLTQSGALTTLTVPTTPATRVGVPVSIYNSSTAPWTLKARRTITAVGTNTVTLDSSVDVFYGDVMVVGERTMSLVGSFSNANSSDSAGVRSVIPRYSLWSMLAAAGSGTAQPGFMGATARSVMDRDGIPTLVSASMTKGESGVEDYSWLGQSSPQRQVSDRRLSLGGAAGSCFQVQLDYTGGAQIRLQQVGVEVS